MNPKPEEKPIQHSGRIIRAEMRTSASPDQVYEAWADPEKIAHWFVDKAEGRAELGATITWIFEKFNYKIPYEVLRAEPGKKFAIRWEPPPGMNAGILEVTISKEAGQTVLRLVNSGFREGAEWNDEYDGVDSGWKMALALLKLYTENYFGTPRSTFLAMRPAQFAFSSVVPFHRTEAGLNQWLTTKASCGEVGEKYAFALREGGTASGRVLEQAKWETALSWDEIHGALELKAFAMGPQKMVSVRCSAWGLESAKVKQIEEQMDRALERLAGLLNAQKATAS
jgi:uncharacterized protein YndB with AHSA1/START domain